jgi:hypothetical protein
MQATTMAAASVLCLMALAGCTGSFDIDQTEPFRVQLDGAPQTVVVREGAEPREVNVETCPSDPCDVEDVDVQLKVTKTSMEACSIKVTIKTLSGEILDEKVIDVGSTGGDTGATSGNGTGNGTTTVTETTTTTQASGGDVTIQNLVVNVKGNKNIIVVTQAIAGAASIDIQAIQATGNADVDADQGGSGSTASASASATMTASSSPTNSTSGNTTTPPY